MDEEFVDNFEDEYSDDSDYDDTEVIIGSKVNEDIHLLMKGYKKKKKNYKTAPALTKYEKEGSDCWFSDDPQRFLGSKYKSEDYEKLSDIVEVYQ